jgi:hypothetical protein
MHRPFPTFAEARTHLLLKEMEIDARPPSPPADLIATSRLVAPGPPSPPTTLRHRARPLVDSASAAVVAVVGTVALSSHKPVAPLLALVARPRVCTHHLHTPWAGTVQMWSYGRPPPAPSAFTAVLQYGYGSPLGSVPGGGAYRTTYTAPPSPYVYGGATPSPPPF